MNSKRVTLGIGIVLLILAVLTTPAAADSIAYFVPQHGNATTDEWVKVTFYADIEAGYDTAGAQQTIRFNPNVIDIGYCELSCDDGPPTGPGQYCWGAFDVNSDYTENGYSWSFSGDPQESVEWPPGSGTYKWESILGIGIEGPVTVEMATYWVHPKTDDTPGVSPFNFNFEILPPECPACQACFIYNYSAKALPVSWNNGTFTHKGQSETFTTSLDLGWNLISLPLTPEDASTSAVLGNDTIAYDQVYKYTSNQFVDVTTGTMETGVGYFVNVTTAGTWSYSGYANEEMSVPLSQGLNCVGWTNTSADIPGGALDSIAGDYRYVARWNAAEQKYELYDAMAPPGVPEFIDFTTMERGVGYFIAAKNSCTLTYP